MWSRAPLSMAPGFKPIFTLTEAVRSGCGPVKRFNSRTRWRQFCDKTRAGLLSVQGTVMVPVPEPLDQARPWPAGSFWRICPWKVSEKLPEAPFTFPVPPVIVHAS